MTQREGTVNRSDREMRTTPHTVIVDGVEVSRSLNSWSRLTLPEVMANIAIELERVHRHDDARHICINLWVEE